HLSNCSIGISGTSGKTTVTGMLATILQENNLMPTVMNGGRVKNLEDKKQASFGSLLVGTDDYFVSEMDESDGSIELFSPDVSVLNNIALDHTSIDQLVSYFQGFIDRCGRFCVLNMDNSYVRALKAPSNAITYGVERENVGLKATNVVARADGIDFDVNGQAVSLAVPGKHNVSNALAALAVSQGIGISLEDAISGIEQFTGIKRRLETLGTSAKGVTVIDDFGHNPDKIAASLETLKEFDGRLIVMFQPHGFAPLRMMGREMAEVFGKYLSKDDVLCVPEVYYAGGTVDRSVTAKDFVQMIEEQGVNVHWFETRDDISPFIHSEMKEGDRVVVMGARDDTLTLFAESFL
ncbi:MAG: glutamate ligase domain-containing protein, partial [Bdellovibrionales bacterium]